MPINDKIIETTENNYACLSDSFVVFSTFIHKLSSFKSSAKINELSSQNQKLT